MFTKFTRTQIQSRTTRQICIRNVRENNSRLFFIFKQIRPKIKKVRTPTRILYNTVLFWGFN